MKLHVLLARRINEDELEALAVADGYTQDVNPDFLHEKLQDARENKEFAQVAIITFQFPDSPVRKVFFPEEFIVQVTSGEHEGERIFPPDIARKEFLEVPTAKLKEAPDQEGWWAFRPLGSPSWRSGEVSVLRSTDREIYRIKLDEIEATPIDDLPDAEWQLLSAER